MPSLAQKEHITTHFLAMEKCKFMICMQMIVSNLQISTYPFIGYKYHNQLPTFYHLCKLTQPAWSFQPILSIVNLVQHPIERIKNNKHLNHQPENILHYTNQIRQEQKQLDPEIAFISI